MEKPNVSDKYIKAKRLSKSINKKEPPLSRQLFSIFYSSDDFESSDESYISDANVS